MNTTKTVNTEEETGARTADTRRFGRRLASSTCALFALVLAALAVPSQSFAQSAIDLGVPDRAYWGVVPSAVEIQRRLG